MVGDSKFSERHGYRNLNAEITIREDAPEDLRFAIPAIMNEMNIQPKNLREFICTALLKSPDPNNWGKEYIQREIYELINTCKWYQVYDIIERIYQSFSSRVDIQEKFANKINNFFCEQGIGYELKNGEIIYRGSPTYTESIKKAIETSEQSGRPRATQEIREAMHDLSRRPDSDRTGAISHAMAALEATARNITNQPNHTLGKLIPELNLPEPLNTAVNKLWGYASERARHIREGQDISASEAELVVTVACSVCTFLNTRE